MSEHNPDRPAWTCLACGDDWPCPTRRRQLIAQYDGAPISLKLYLVSQFVHAVSDRPDKPGGLLFGRIVGWAPRSRRG